MLFIFSFVKPTRNIRLPSFKLFITTHSTVTRPDVKKLSSTRKQQCLSDVKSVRCSLASSSLIPTTALSDGQECLDVKNQLVPKKLEATDDQGWQSVHLESAKLQKHCFMLSKIRLTSLVVATTMAGYMLAPGPFDVSTFAACSIGTGLVSATANSINQFFEVPFDAQMSRTKNRVLVRGYLTPGHAITFASVAGLTGLLLLYSEVNGLTAALGATNLVLYTLIYTPMKRITILNTWIGSVVGAIPPLMGWASCMGDISSPGAWIMSGLLYAWQFPHFNALSWNLRPDYSRAGYRMMAVTNPQLCRKTALRYTVALTGLCYLAPVLDVTNWWFALMSTPLNTYFLYLAWKFNKHSDSKSSRKLFHFSLIHLPVLMALILVNKKHCAKSKQEDRIGCKEQESDIFATLTGAIASLTSSSTQ